MVAMTAPDLWQYPDRLLTVDDLEDLFPDDDRRFELDDGVLIVSPAPVNMHQLVVARLMAVLTAACPNHLAVLPGVSINITRYQHRIPDVAVVPIDSLSTKFQERPPLLAVEISSRSTRLYDRNRKKDVYEGFGIRAYWIVEPEPEDPRLIVFELSRRPVRDCGRSGRRRAVPHQAALPVTIRAAVLVRTGPLD